MLILLKFRNWLILSLLFFVISPDIHAQSAALNQKISLQFNDISLDTLLKEISGLTDIHFSYSAQFIDVHQRISYTCKNRPLKVVLDEIFLMAGIKYSIVNGYFVLRLDETSGNSDVKPKTYTISGTIVDSVNNEIMIGAIIYLEEIRAGVQSNNYGFYSLTIPSGTYTLRTSYVGYISEQKKMHINSNATLNIQLNPQPYELKEIIIQSFDKEQLIFGSLASQTNINPVAVRRQSAALGETDMLKSLDNIAGISFQSDGSSFFSVRGGAKDQNLILLDEAPIFNPSHMLGLFTPIIPEAIKHTEIYKADFPVQYGGRISSVIDIRARDGNMVKFSGSASIGPVSSRISAEGPFRKNYNSYFVALRVSTFGLLVKAANPSIDRFFFADFTSKFNFKLGKRDRLFVTLFSGKDAFINKPGNVKNGLEWANTAATLRWSHIYGTRLFSNTTIYASKYDYALYTDYDKKISWNSDINSYSLKSEFMWYVNPSNNVKFGLNISGYRFNPGNYNSQEPSFDTLRISQVNSGELIFYAGDEIKLTRWLKMNVGFRLSNWSNYGEGFTIEYDNNYVPGPRANYEKGVRYFSKNYFEPRISISLKTGRFSAFKASYNRTIQHIHLINNSISPFSGLDVWLPSGPNIKPQHADIADVGFLNFWPDKEIEIASDVYYKKMANQIGYAEHAELFMNPYLEGELRQGDGYAYGLEITLKKSGQKLGGQISYAYTRSSYHIQGLNNGDWYFSAFDKPIEIALTLDYKIRPRWTLNLNSVYSSGMVFTSPSAFYYYRGAQVPVYNKVNNDRLPDYKRVDIGSIWRLNKVDKAFEHYFTFTVYNLFNTHNYVFMYFNKVEGNDGKFYVPGDRLNPQFQVPTYRYVYSVIPSFTYSLKF